MIREILCVLLGYFGALAWRAASDLLWPKDREKQEPAAAQAANARQLAW